MIAAALCVAVPLGACSCLSRPPLPGPTSAADEPETPPAGTTQTPQPLAATAQESPTTSVRPSGTPAPTPEDEPTAPECAGDKFDPTLAMLLVLREGKAPPGEAAEIVGADTVEVYVQFTHVLDDPTLERLEELGMIFYREGGRVVHVGTVYSVETPWDALCSLAERQEVQSIEPAWKPGLEPPGAGG